MSATKESRIKTLGIIAGGGALPARLVHACKQRDIEMFLVGFEGQTDPALCEGHNYLMTRIGAAGQIIKTLKAHHIKDLVLIGSIRRPSLVELKPDLRTAEFFARLGLRSLGDNDLLRALREELENEGFTIHGVQEFAEDLLAGEGIIGRYKPKKADQVDIDRGIELSQMLGAYDVGQSVIVQEGIVLGVEAAEGTDSLIRRCSALKRKGRGGVLVKTCKPQQDHDLDLPTIGPQTVLNCAEAGLAGIVIESGHSLILDCQKVVELANKNKMFIVGIKVNSKDGSGKKHAA
jgi:DUF1009 family protein